MGPRQAGPESSESIGRQTLTLNGFRVRCSASPRN